jgi:hypothetical protein
LSVNGLYQRLFTLPPGVNPLKKNMKSAYELAMERLNKANPASKITDAQKKQLAELDSKYAAKVAEREIGLNDAIKKAGGDASQIDALREQLAMERKKIQVELEEKKELVRKGQFKG